LNIFKGFEVPVSIKTPLKKVEKKSVLSKEYRAGEVREQVPLKQGLKQKSYKICQGFFVC